MAETSDITSTKMQDFEEWLGAPARTEHDLVRLIERGLPTSFISNLIRHGISRQEAFSIIINPRTFKHRKSKKQPLSREESERAVRTVRVISRAQAVLGDQERALEWMRAPKKRFDGRTPMQMLATEPGGRLVDEMLVQIDEGMFA